MWVKVFFIYAKHALRPFFIYTKHALRRFFIQLKFSVWKNIINFYFPRGQEKKKDINPNLAGLFRVCFEVVVGKITPLPPPYLKLVRIMLETWNLVCMYTHKLSFRKYTFMYQGPLNFADVSIFSKKLVFFG